MFFEFKNFFLGLEERLRTTCSSYNFIRWWSSFII